MLRSRFLLFFAPIGVYLVWLLLRLALKKRPSRFEVSTGLSLLLLLYFLTVVGTGIFWVAAQELPVFDWHYLPGYLLLLVAIAHVVLHWKSLALFFRRRAPVALVEADGQQFRTWVRGTGYGLLALALAGGCFLAGTRHASQRFSFSGGDTEVSNASSAAAKEGEPLPPRRLRAAPVTVSLAQFYHDGCSYPNRFNLPGLTISARPPVLKSYSGQPTTALPDGRSGSGPSVLEAYRLWLSGAASAAPALSLEQLSLLLFHTQGINESKTSRSGITYDLRTAPSAGALYPVNVYVLAQRVSGLAPGLYYYDPKQAALVVVRENQASEALASLSGSPDLIRSAPATVLFTSTFGRTAFKYGERSYRYVNMDTGHAAYNLALGAAALGLRAPMITRFEDASVNHLLGVEAATESALLIQPLGSSAALPDAEPRFLSAPLAKAKGSFLDLIHGGTALRMGKTHGPRTTFPVLDRPGKERLSLPSPALGGALFPAIRARRSVRNYAAKTMELEELSALCEASAGGGPGAQDPLLSGSAPLNLYLFVRDVHGLVPGVYRYHVLGHSVELVRAGDFSKACMNACLQQEFCGSANVVFAKTVSWDYLGYPDGDRGYRYACLRAGFMGEGLYLQGTALNIGVCGVGAFEDGTIAQLLGLDPTKEVCLYITAAGKL